MRSASSIKREVIPMVASAQCEAVRWPSDPSACSFVCDAPLPEPQKPRLLDRVREEIRKRHYSRRKEKSYVGWIRRFILFHGKRHPAEMGEEEISRYLSHLAVSGRVSALFFLYRQVLCREIEWVEGVVRAKRPLHLPVVLTREEVRTVLRQLQGVEWMMASLLYGAGLRLLECCRLRVKDIDLDKREIVVRDGKGRQGSRNAAPGEGSGATEGSSGGCAQAARGGSCQRCGERRVALGHRAEVSSRALEVGLAVDFSGDALLRAPGHRPKATASPA